MLVLVDRARSGGGGGTGAGINGMAARASGKGIVPMIFGTWVEGAGGVGEEVNVLLGAQRGSK